MMMSKGDVDVISVPLANLPETETSIKNQKLGLDDAWKRNTDNVIPVIIRYNIPVTIFVCTDSVKDGTYWWLKVRQAPHVLPVPYRTTQEIRKD
jgi:peptidoglycan/xylan/chitin deacetylase (PgdA/CDA1 family)